MLEAMTALPVPGPSRKGVAGPPMPEVPRVRLERHVIHLSDGRQVGLAVAGQGVPLVVVHGFAADGMLYAPTLSRLVSMGFKVLAIDVAGHGQTGMLPPGGHDLRAYAGLLGQSLDELGIRWPLLVGHSMGGRLVAELAAERPDDVTAVVLVDAIVGAPWDWLVRLFRVVPGLLVPFAVVLGLDTAATVATIPDASRVASLGRSLVRITGHALARPWRLAGPAVSILRSPGTASTLERLAACGVPVVVLHGERDLVVPLPTALDAGARARCRVVVVHGAGHSWLLADPETFPAALSELLRAELGDAYEWAVARAGLDPRTATVAEVEAALYPEGAWIRELTPPLELTRSGRRRRPPRYRWTTVREPDPHRGRVGLGRG
jgi:pimeloyl-ACP methyl ester carboxylesterase